MTQPWLDDGDVQLYHGDVIETLRALPAGIAQTCVTSPPYWGLRSYLDEDHADKATELGLEATPALYVERIVAVFREVWRVLRSDGTVWLNLGDSYNNRSVGRPSSHQGGLGFTNESIERSWADQTKLGLTRLSINDGRLKEKDLVGVPWMVAFALQADGWYLRSDVIWSKPNPMPESVTDRPTKAHEYLFLLTKQPRYYYDADAIREPHVPSNAQRTTAHYDTAARYGADNGGNGGLDALATRMRSGDHAGRNRRSVWTIATQPFPEAHFATYPEALVRPCILAGTSERGECRECGAPWTREVERVGAVKNTDYADESRSAMQQGGVSSTTLNGTPSTAITTGWVPSCACDSPSQRHHERYRDRPNSGKGNPNRKDRGGETMGGFGLPAFQTTGWSSSCSCSSPGIIERYGPMTQPQTVLDPFIGSGTTAHVARKHGRRCIGIDLSSEYLEIAARRLAQQSLLGGAA